MGRFGKLLPIRDAYNLLTVQTLYIISNILLANSNKLYLKEQNNVIPKMIEIYYSAAIA